MSSTSDPLPSPSRLNHAPTDSRYWEAVYDDISLGDRDVKGLIVAWSGFCHTVDDAVDQDQPANPDAIVTRMLHWTETVSENPFFDKNRTTLMAFVISAANVFIDSARWERSDDPRKRHYADAYRSFWCEMVYHIAYLAGGFGHMRAMAAKYRDLAWDAQHEPDPLPLLESAPEPDPVDPPIRPKLIPFQVCTPEDWSRLEAFAKSFNHYIDRRFPYLVIKTNDERWVGFAMMLAIPAPGAPGVPIACTSWHPDAPARECVEGMKLLTSWAMVSYGKSATVIPFDSPLLPHMERLGYRGWDLKLYVTD